MKSYLQAKDEVLTNLQSDEKNGLSSAVATQRLEENGKNKLAAAKKKSSRAMKMRFS